MTTSSAISSRLGFHPNMDAVRVDRLEVRGRVPAWLHGDLVRVTPSLSPDEHPVMRHWFDGLAMLHSFSIHDGTAAYASRRLATRTAAMADEGRWGANGFGTDPERRRGERLATFRATTLNDNTNVNLARLGDRYLALTETPVPNEWDPATLECRGLVEFQDRIGGFLSTAHPHFDVATGGIINLVTHRGPRGHTYRLYTWAPGTDRRQPLGQIPIDRPRYLHSFALTERYLVLVMGPLFYDLLEIRLRDRSVLDSLRWEPDQATKVYVVDRGDGRVVREVETEPLFLFHHVNAFEEGPDLVVDLVAWDDPSPIWALLPERLQNPEQHVAAFCGSLERLTVPLGPGPVRRVRLADPRIEFPRINHERCSTRRHRFSYATEYSSPASDWFDAVVKLDHEGGRAVRWSEPGCYVGEPVFVARPGDDAEDGGVLLSIVLDAPAGGSFLVVLEARDLSELARIHAPHHLAFDFHGAFFGARP